MTGKLLGAALVLGAVLWAVLTRLRQRRQDTELLRQLSAALEDIAAAIRWQRRSLPQAIAAQGRYSLAGPYFRRVAAGLADGGPLQETWRQTFAALSVESALLTALELSGDEEKLTQGLLYTAAQLKERCRQRQAEQRQTAKLWLAGTLSAAGLLIILLI